MYVKEMTERELRELIRQTVTETILELAQNSTMEAEVEVEQRSLMPKAKGRHEKHEDGLHIPNKAVARELGLFLK